MIEPQAADLLAYLQKEGLSLDSLKIVPHTYSPFALISGSVAAMSAYETDELFLVQQAGVDVLEFSPRTGGIDFYGDNLFTTEQELAAHPERARAFRDASLRGWEYAMDHPEEIADLISSQYSQQHGRDFHLFEAQRMAPLLRADLVEVGYMNRGRWRHIADTYADLGLLPRDYSLDGFLYEPDRPPDLTKLYLALTLLLAVSALALYIFRVNRRLALALAEKSRSEERHRIIFQTSASAGVVWHEGFIVTDWNRQAEALFGWTRAEVLGKRFVDFLLPAPVQARLTTELAPLDQDQLLPYSVNDNLTRDGRVITCEWFNAWLPERPG